VLRHVELTADAGRGATVAVGARKQAGARRFRIASPVRSAAGVFRV